MALETFMLFFLATVVSILLESITMGSRSQNVKDKTLQLSKAKVNVSFLHGKNCLKKLWQTKKVKTRTSSTKVCPHLSTVLQTIMIDLRIFHTFLQMCLTLLRKTPFLKLYANGD